MLKFDAVALDIFIYENLSKNFTNNFVTKNFVYR